jgi:EAL domain-containing protein (putative c-di-GMP-specific phosphodiesterase class I)
MSGARWPAATLARNANKPLEGWICATMWPTVGLQSRSRWFDELYCWTEGFAASTMQRARIQLAALAKAFALLERERARQVGVTLSFGTVERTLDAVTDTIEAYRLHAHRLCVLLRGQVERLRSPYRVSGFIEWLRAHQVPVGYRLAAARIGMEMRAIDFIAPDFAKVIAPASKRAEYWNDFALEARAAGLRLERTIVAGIEDTAQRDLARGSGFGFGQGHALRAPYDPPSTGTRAGAGALVMD